MRKSWCSGIGGITLSFAWLIEFLVCGILGSVLLLETFDGFFGCGKTSTSTKPKNIAFSIRISHNIGIALISN